MNVTRTLMLGLTTALVLLTGATSGQPPHPMGTAFTYQGRLESSGNPVTDTCDFEFSLWDDAAAGTQQGLTLPMTISVDDGLFTIDLDFGEQFNGEARWLELAVCCPSPCTVQTLTPRQELTPTPHALALPGLWSQQNAICPNLVGGHSANTVTAGICGATIGGGGHSGLPNQVTNDFGTVGGGIGNTASGGADTVGGGSFNTASAIAATVGGGEWNTASGWHATVPGGKDNWAQGDYSFAAGRRAKVRSAEEVGGSDTDGDEGTFVWADSTDADFTSTGPNQFLIRAAGGVGIGTTTPTEELDVAGDIHASGTIASGSSITIDGAAHRIDSDGNLDINLGDGRALRLESNANGPNLIGGLPDNTVSGGVRGATIGGGGGTAVGIPGGPHRVYDSFGTIAGGTANCVGSNDGDPESDMVATVGGGVGNLAEGYASTISGGYENTASGQFATVAGGYFNEALGHHSSVPGGRSNTAAGMYSFAAGQRARATHTGTFVWSDSTTALPDFFTSTGSNQFLINATGGVGIGTTTPTEELDVAGDIHASGTIASGSSLTIDGTTDTITSTEDLELHVSTGRALRIEPNATSPNLIGGYSGNTVTAGAVGATIGGGGQSGWPNRVTHGFGTVGGGQDNTAGGWGATVGGGEFNTASGDQATVGGGSHNIASGSPATVGGGYYNTASGADSTVGGGEFNTASGGLATVPGGYANVAGGDTSFAGGYRATVRDNDPESPYYSGDANGDEGTFVWADSTSAAFVSTGPDQFLIRAAGGVGIGTNNPSGFQLAVNGSAAKPGGGSWSVFSDRRLKKNIHPLRGALQRLLRLRGVTFECKDADFKLALPGRQTGLIAQDVEQVFPEWVDEDSDGYKYVTVRGLEAIVVEALRELREEKDTEIAELECERDVQQERIADLEARLAALEKLVRHAGAEQEGGGR